MMTIRREKTITLLTINMVLIFSDPKDLHALVVQKRLEKLDYEVIILSLKDYPQKWSLSIDSSNCFLHFNNRKENVNNFRGIWHRRYQVIKISESVIDEKVKRFSHNEAENLVSSITFFYNGNEINNPLSDKKADKKALQLKNASDCSLIIPETIITSNFEEVYRFAKKNNKLIFKSLTGTPFQFSDTRLITINDLESHKESIEIAPTIFQNFIEGPYHLRVNVIDEKVYAAKIVITEEVAEVDWRIDPNIEISNYEISKELRDKILNFMKLSNLRFGALDFKKSNKGDYVFLEVNSGGQFLFIEIETEQLISQAIANSLVKN